MLGNEILDIMIPPLLDQDGRPSHTVRNAVIVLIFIIAAVLLIFLLRR
jgi:hypothetical protein